MPRQKKSCMWHHSCINQLQYIFIEPLNGTYQKWTLNYYDSRNYCWKLNRLLLPSSYCGSDSSFSNGVTAWTNVFRKTFDTEKSGNFFYYLHIYWKLTEKTVKAFVYLCTYLFLCCFLIKMACEINIVYIF